MEGQYQTGEKAVGVTISLFPKKETVMLLSDSLFEKEVIPPSHRQNFSAPDNLLFAQDGILRDFGYPELHHFFGRYFDRFTGLGISSGSRFPMRQH